VNPVASSGPRYWAPDPDGRLPRSLAAKLANGEEVQYRFYGHLEIGRDDEQASPEPGLLLLPDPTVSRRHCAITQRAGGQCFVRDMSRNGTRVDGRRLVPNVETQLSCGAAIAIGGFEFVLVGEDATGAHAKGVDSVSTIPLPTRAIATVLVGDIRAYTVLVRKALSDQLQQSVTRLFDDLGQSVVAHGGTVKEYQGDAVLAFWEGDARGAQAIRACRAALALEPLAREIAQHPSRWPFPDHPLEMDFALATGLVLIDSFGKGQPTGLSMMGEPVVRAFRIEKFANAVTGSIVVCAETREAAREGFRFRDLGEQMAKGFDRPDRVFALLGPAS
jgi:class 3 adenylate cyclase